MRSFFLFLSTTKAMKSSMIKTSGTYPGTEFYGILLIFMIFIRLSSTSTSGGT